jgi:ATP synthase I chain
MNDHDPSTEADPLDSAESHALVRRILVFASICWAVFAVFLVFFAGWKPLIGLTCSAAVAMISFLWLGEIVNTVLQPAPRIRPWRLGVRTFARFALLGAALSVAIFVARFHPVSVLLGFSVIVGAIMIEAVVSLVRFGKSAD